MYARDDESRGFVLKLAFLLANWLADMGVAKQPFPPIFFEGKLKMSRSSWQRRVEVMVGTG